ncbi:feather keratin-like [Rissa tridactyla]|uniref:feather keratin-like n=1 Tax=Rissa tridactyla TaxID=75485 RepID=UPI0023BA4BFE|nr:feather keratin-like [Rissa tridactyla]
MDIAEQVKCTATKALKGLEHLSSEEKLSELGGLSTRRQGPEGEVSSMSLNPEWQNDLCGPCGPTPLANSCNEPCVRQCEASRVIIQPPAVQVTLPGPILTSFPQSTAVGSSASAAVGNELSAQGVPISSGGFGFGYGYGLGGLGCYGGRRGCYPC